jgi:GMP synthase-like glutamine amidotransferase
MPRYIHHLSSFHVLVLTYLKIGVHTIHLTEKGSKFYNGVLPEWKSYKIRGFHKREVETPGRGLLPLAEHAQSFLHKDNTVFTIQGHPEMSSEFGKFILPGATGSYMAVQEAEVESIAASLDTEHDGSKIWKRILTWVTE